MAIHTEVGKAFGAHRVPQSWRLEPGDTEVFSEEWDEKDLCSAGAAGAEPGDAAAAL